jgi:hypothetical protein
LTKLGHQGERARVVIGHDKKIAWSLVAQVLTGIKVDVPEWLSGMTRNHVGFARAGSNPAVHDLLFIVFLIFKFRLFYV